MTTPSAGGPLPLKPGESPEPAEKIAVDLAWEWAETTASVKPMAQAINAALKSYGDRRGEEERAKALERMAAVERIIEHLDRCADEAEVMRKAKDDAGHPADARFHAGRCAAYRGAATSMRGTLAAAPSGDAKGTMACPICGVETPHQHRTEEIETWRRGSGQAPVAGDPDQPPPRCAAPHPTRGGVFCAVAAGHPGRDPGAHEWFRYVPHARDGGVRSPLTREDEDEIVAAIAAAGDAKGTR